VVLDVRDAPASLSLSDYSAAVIAASVHVGKHECGSRLNS
jgi:menaquinone-dependent protoporphyrinogen IX oxidase